MIRIFYLNITLILTSLAFGVKAEAVNTISIDTSYVNADSLAHAHDSLSIDSATVDSINKPDRVFDFPVKYTMQDSGIIYMKTKKFFLYNSGDLTYDQINLKADHIEIDFNKKELTASGVQDTVGDLKGNPIFNDHGSEYEALKMRYNFDTEKGIIENVITEQDGGYIHSEWTKKISDDEMLLRNGKYTTCDAEHPHFYMQLSKGKFIKGDKIITGPAHMVFEDVHIPLYIPFGFFPSTPSYSSGFILPTYGEEKSRGFYLRNFGYYLAASEYFDVTALGEIYTMGSWGIKLSTNYKKRYKYSGGLNFSYNMNKIGDPEVPASYSESKGYSLSWNFSQDAKVNPSTSFSANVNLSTSSYDKENSYNSDSYLQQQKSSSISFRKRWENSPFNLTVSARHSQNSRDSTISLGLPNLNFTMNRIYPFKWLNKSKSAKWYEQFTFSYGLSAQNSINNVKEDELFNMNYLKDWSNSINNNISVGLPSMNLLGIINISPSISYDEDWYLKRYKKTIMEDTLANGTIDSVLMSEQEMSFGRYYNYSFGISTSTNMYGMYTMKNPNWKLKAIRHKITPSVSFNFKPDFSDDKYGFYDSYIDETGNRQYYNIFTGSNGKSGSESSSMSMSLLNSLEGKKSNSNDTTENAEKYAKFKIFDLSLNSSYNFVADSLNFSNISGNIRTSVRDLNFNVSFNVDPYDTDSTGRKINKFMWQNGSGLGKLGRITSVSTAFGMDFSSKDGKEKIKKERNRRYEQAILNPFLGYNSYVDFSIPWRFSFNYSISYSKPNRFVDHRLTQVLNFNGSLSLTSKWNISFNSGYDFTTKEITYTSFNLSRNLHCWEFNLNFIPFGPRTSYGFTIRASSSMLSDLKIDKRKNWRDQ
ncbi:MAG: putative LPS assembly protein LptD [Bacteroidales bacterium]